MASFGGSGLAGDWLSGGGLRDAVSLGLPAAGPKPVVYDWSTWTPAAPVHGIDDRPKGATTFDAFASMMAGYSAKHPHASLAAPIGGGASTTDPTSIGGDWAGVDRWNSAISSAASQTGVDPDLIKAVMKLESNGDPNAAGASGVWGPMQVNANAWGNGPWMTDANANILKGAQILKSNLDQYGGDVRMALRAYHGFGSDGYTTDQQYADIVLGNFNQLKSGAGAMTGAGMPLVSAPAAAGANNPAGLSVLNVALGYVGKIPYVWGGIPGKGQDPAQTGWDCSGLTYWLDQNYGTGTLPMGSHYQYQQAASTGRLFTDASQLQAGDLIFIDTGWQGGAGAEMNRAGHVAIYLGNGKILHAANPDQGTIVSDISSYMNGQYGSFLGAEHMSWSGGGFGVPGQTATADASPLGQWRSRVLGGGSGASPIATNDPLAAWRMTHVGG